MVLRIGERVVVLLCGLALSACAHQRSVGELGSAVLAANAGLPQRAGDGPLFDGQARMATDDSLLQAESSLKIEPGNLFGLAPSPTGPRTRLARQLLTQKLSSRLPVTASAPVGLSYSQSRQTQWWLNTDAGATTLQQAQLSWAPAPLNMNLSWSRNESLVRPVLDCGVEGAIGFATANEGPSLQLRGRNCSVFAPRMPMIDTARGWSAALMWPQLLQRTTMRLTTLQPQPQPASGIGAAPAYELGLVRAQQLGSWSASGALAMRHGSAAPGRDTQGDWSADASLKRRLGEVDVTASYRTGSGDDWFLPVSADRVERMALGLGLSRWLEPWLPVDGMDFGLSYQWLSREPALGPTVADAMLNGRLSWRW